MASFLSMRIFLVLFCFSSKAVQCSLSLQRNDEPQLGSFCSRKCEKPSEQPTNEDTDIPLYQCSCSPSCSVYGDCCFDSPYNNTKVQRNMNFMCLTVVGHDRYRAVSGCPSNVAANFCKDGLGLLPPVTSRITNITYTNIFCAECNEDKDNLITWNVELRCSSDANNGTKYTYKSGKIWNLNKATGSKTLCKYYIQYNDSSFIERLELRSCMARTRKRSRCSQSWKDTAVSEMCRSYEDPVYFHNALYRNAHCALCNYLNPEFADCIPDRLKDILKKGEIDFDAMKHFCKTRGSDACIQNLADKWKGRQYAFADLLNINEKRCVPPQGSRCCEGERFDSRSQRCRKVRY